MKRKLHLLLIDPQNDFCDLPDAYLPPQPATGERQRPALPVQGAHADMLRVADLIERGGAGLENITVTMDAHNRYDIAHPDFWMNGEGGTVLPFTQITADDVRAGRYIPRRGHAERGVQGYLDALEAAGRYQLMVWPVHCEIGSWGQNVHHDVRAAYNRWEAASLGVVRKIAKGENPRTEHYSAVMAEVPDPEDEGTQLNTRLIGSLARAERIYIAGEAGSHCVKASTEHIAAQIGASRIVLLTDCMSPVRGFEARQEQFLRRMAAQGARLATCADVLPELTANR